jgi:molecular chaperone DnaK (HSP70)
MSWLMAIDVGTSSTAAATVTPGGEPTLLSFDGAPVMGSGVLLDDRGELVVGAAAERFVGSSPDHYERSPKRRLGDRVMLLGGRPVEPVAAIAAILSRVLEVAVARQGGPPDALRMTVPARWGAVRAGLLSEAAVRAGLPEPVLVPEPVAAALFAAETGLAPGSHVAVYDLGGGTLDTAVLRRSDTGFEVVGAPGGNDQLGGELFDDLVFEHLGARIAEVAPDAWEQIRYSSERPWQRLGHELRIEARRAKEALSSATEYDLYLGAPLDMEGRVTRDELEALLRPALSESVGELVATVRRAGITPADLDRVYVVGGATRTPLVVRLIAEGLGMMPVTWGDPKAAVVLGAASPAALTTLHRPASPSGTVVADEVTTADLASAITGEIARPGDPSEAEPVTDAPEPEPAPADIDTPEPGGAADSPEPEPVVSIEVPEPVASIEPPAADSALDAAEPTPPAPESPPGSSSPTESSPTESSTGAGPNGAINPWAVAITLACATAAVVLTVILVMAALS